MPSACTCGLRGEVQGARRGGRVGGVCVRERTAKWAAGGDVSEGGRCTHTFDTQLQAPANLSTSSAVMISPYMSAGM